MVKAGKSRIDRYDLQALEVSVWHSVFCNITIKGVFISRRLKEINSRSVIFIIQPRPRCSFAKSRAEVVHDPTASV